MAPGIQKHNFLHVPSIKIVIKLSSDLGISQNVIFFYFSSSNKIEPLKNHLIFSYVSLHPSLQDPRDTFGQEPTVVTAVHLAQSLIKRGT